MNIWIHLTSLCLLICTGIYLFSLTRLEILNAIRLTFPMLREEFHPIPSISEVGRWPIALFLCSACLCLSFSVLYHLFVSFSMKVSRVLHRMDYAGINFLISGTSIPYIYYGFYCHAEVIYALCSVMTTIALLLFTVSLTDFFHQEEWRIVKVLSYLGFGAIATAPVFLLMVTESELPYRAGLSSNCFMFMAISYVSGLMIYAVRVPERFKPGHFDICGHSHQFWHLAVVLGIVSSFSGTLINYWQREMHPVCPLSAY